MSLRDTTTRALLEELEKRIGCTPLIDFSSSELAEELEGRGYCVDAPQDLRTPAQLIEVHAALFVGNLKEALYLMEKIQSTDDRLTAESKSPVYRADNPIYGGRS